MATTTSCKRHPDVETRLTCSTCGDAICPRCAVPSHVGQKCPSCARQARGARAAGKPRQYAKAVGLGLLAAGLVAGALVLVFGIPFVGWIAAGFGGYLVARAVRIGAEGNGSDPFRWLSMAFAVAAILGAFLVATGSVLPGRGLFAIGAYVAAVWGALHVYR